MLLSARDDQKWLKRDSLTHIKEELTSYFALFNRFSFLSLLESIDGRLRR